jgi:thiamine-monophosphate kinase
MPTLADLGEFEVIRRLTAARSLRGTGVIIGAGDDAAVLRPGAGRDLVVTADSFVEGRHYDARWMDAETAGRRLAIANLSDMAAMAAEPRWALHSCGARRDQSIEWLLAFERGLDRALGQHGAVLVGGNLTAVDGAAWSDLTLMGEVERGAAWTRSGARAGDRIAVTGWPGRAGAGFLLASRIGEAAREPRWRDVFHAWTTPASRVALARALAPLRAVTAAVDLSDGLAGDLAHLCAAGGVGAVLDAARWPEDQELAAAAEALGVPLETLRLGPSDDYELLLAIRPESFEACLDVARSLDVPLHAVGEIKPREAGVSWHGPTGTTPIVAGGFDHFGPGGRPIQE